MGGQNAAEKQPNSDSPLEKSDERIWYHYFDWSNCNLKKAQF